MSDITKRPDDSLPNRHGRRVVSLTGWHRRKRDVGVKRKRLPRASQASPVLGSEVGIHLVQGRVNAPIERDFRIRMTRWEMMARAVTTGAR